MASDSVGYIGTLLNIYNFLKELVDHKISMKEEHSSEGSYLTIRFTAVNTKSMGVNLFKRFILMDSTKPWSVETSFFVDFKTYDLTPKVIEKFEQIHVKFPKTNSGIEAYNTMVNAYHNHDLVSQFKVLTYLKHLCDPNVSSFRKGDVYISKLSTDTTYLPSADKDDEFGGLLTYYTNFKMELTIS